MEYNSDFKYDLDLGQLGEKLVYDILTNKKVEVKTDYQASATGNVFNESCQVAYKGIRKLIKNI